MTQTDRSQGDQHKRGTVYDKSLKYGDCLYRDKQIERHAYKGAETEHFKRASAGFPADRSVCSAQMCAINAGVIGRLFWEVEERRETTV
jgi:hypothetical protein